MSHSTYTTTQTGQEHVLRESRAGRRPLTLLTGLQLPRWAHPPLARSPIAESSTSPPLLCVAPLASLSPRPRHVSSTGQSGTRYPPGRKLRPSIPLLHQCHHCQSGSIANAIFTLGAAATLPSPHKIVVPTIRNHFNTYSLSTTEVFSSI